jgi:hypothetical protein
VTLNSVDQTLHHMTTIVARAVLLALAVAILAATMTWASRMAVRKNRSKLWVFWTFLASPFVLVLWLLPARKARR